VRGSEGEALGLKCNRNILLILEARERALPLWILKKLSSRLNNRVPEKAWEDALRKVEELTFKLEEENKGIGLLFFDIDWFLNKFNEIKREYNSSYIIIEGERLKVDNERVVCWIFGDLWKEEFGESLLEKIQEIIDSIVKQYKSPP